MFILAASTAFSRVLTLMQVPQTISEWILNNFQSGYSVAGDKSVPVVGGNGDGYHPGHPDSDTDPASNCSAIGMDPIQFGYHGCKPLH